jgi:hypothetical protein
LNWSDKNFDWCYNVLMYQLKRKQLVPVADIANYLAELTLAANGSCRQYQVVVGKVRVPLPYVVVFPTLPMIAKY